jgi:trans-2,3-dihydro-3-hydroxyanthranilate isomerase
MADYLYRIVNVFTRGGTLTGNPLCVFENATGMTDADMQALALQFNLSETTFILPSDKADARVRIFTPAYEMPFAGHPTLGTAQVVHALKGAGPNLKLEMKAGVIPVRLGNGRWELAANAPRWRDVTETKAELAAMLGLEEAAILNRPLWVNAGKEQLVVPLRSPDDVRNAKPGAAFSSLRSEDGHCMAYVFAPHDAATIVSRFFFPKGPAVAEDPATGSACANLGGWFTITQPGAALERTILQGDQVGRPSTLFLRVDADQNIFVGGEVVELAKGVLTL